MPIKGDKDENRKNIIMSTMHGNKSGGKIKTTSLYFSAQTYQCSTAEQDHEDDEALKPVMLHNPEAGFS